MLENQPVTPNTPIDRPELFVQLFAQSRDRIFAYIVALVQQVDVAEEVFQQTSVVLWRRFEDFDVTGNFTAWARGVAHNTVRNYLRSQRRDRHVFSDGLLDAFAADQETHPQETEVRWAALNHCMGKLRPQDHDLVRQFYAQNLTAGDLAKQTRRSVPAIRKAIHRIRTALVECVQRRITEAPE